MNEGYARGRGGRRRAWGEYERMREEGKAKRERKARREGKDEWMVRERERI